nr:MAG TPA: hypothetical protein [Caudoviricetes sp.]
MAYQVNLILKSVLGKVQQELLTVYSITALRMLRLIKWL